jgi:putative transposase
MPRRARFVISGIGHHIIQRGHNRQVVFATDEDFQCGNLTSALRYGYCLMTNHVHLLLVPPAVNSLALLLKHVASRQTRYANGLERRTGRL